jgi:Flp pilus assembly pilin Flp
MAARRLLKGTFMVRRQSSSSLRGLARDQRGAVSIEYLVSVAIGLVVATALAGMGAQIGISAERARAVLSSDSP